MNQNDNFKYLNSGLPQDIAYEKAIGNFSKAKQLINLRLKDQTISNALRSSLIVQKEIINRLPSNYPYTFEEAYEEVKKLIPDFKKEELQKYLDERRFSYIYIDKEIHIFKTFIDVLKKYDDFTSRIKDYEKFELENWNRYKTVRYIKDNKKLAYRICIRQTLKIKDEKFIPNENYLVHLPIPTKCDLQSDIRIENAYPQGYVIDDENCSCRTIYWNTKLEKNVEFVVEYSYLSSYEYVELNKKSISGNYDFYVNEQEPHIVFTKLVKDTAFELTKDFNNPLDKAKAIYDYMTKNMRYSFQPEYFVMDNIVETCLKTMRGDCGVFAITFITLCRAIGIPAHWESSKCILDDEVSSHDWARFYIEPYGWLYADVSYGIGSNSHNFEEGREYYFGNLDPYRMIANNEFQKDLSGNKKYWRSDPYDNQVGEVEDSKRGYIVEIDFNSNATLLKMEKVN